MRRRWMLVSFALAASCRSASEPLVDNGDPVSPVGSYSLSDSVVGSTTFPASGGSMVVTAGRESTYVWSGAQKRAGRWRGPVTELTFIDTLASFVGVFRGTASSSRMTLSYLNESVIYHFQRR